MKLNPPLTISLIVIAALVWAAHINRDYRTVKVQQPLAAQSTEIPPAETNPVRSEWRSERDLEAQSQMAKWAAVAGIAACIGVAITGLGVIFVKQTLEATRRAVEEAARGTDIVRQMGEAQVRAYLTASNVHLHIDPKTHAASVEFKVFNSGNSPAFNTLADVALAYGINGHKGIDDTTPAKGLLLGVIRQGEDVARTIDPELAIAADDKKLSKTRTMLFLVRVTINYLDVFERRQTDKFDFVGAIGAFPPPAPILMAPQYEFHMG